MLIQQIIQFSSEGQQQFESFLKLHVIKHVLGMMSSSSMSSCVSALVDLRQRLVDKAEWIFEWINPRSIVDEAFEEVLRDHPDLCNVVNAQVSVLCQSFK